MHPRFRPPFMFRIYFSSTVLEMISLPDEYTSDR
jgi:hypothetical protein